jgi:hypothetical protein
MQIAYLLSTIRITTDRFLAEIVILAHISAIPGLAALLCLTGEP